MIESLYYWALVKEFELSYHNSFGSMVNKMVPYYDN